MPHEAFNNTLTLNWKEKIQLGGAVLFLLTLPYSREVNQVFMGIFLVSCLPSISRTLWLQQKANILVFTSIFFVSLLSSIYAPDIRLAGKQLELQSTLLLVPVIMGISYKPSVIKNNIIKVAFITGVCSALIYLMSCFLIKLENFDAIFTVWERADYLNHNYSRPIGMHASYLSAYVALVLFFLSHFLVRINNWWVKITCLLLAALCFLSLLLLTSRMILFATFLCLIFIFPYKLKKGKWIVALILGLFVVTIFIVMFTNNEYFQKRFGNELSKDLKWKELNYIIGTSGESDSLLKNDGSRIERWIAATRLIKENFLLGYGTGEEKNVLFRKYKEMGLTVTLEQQYDSHNQFMAFTLKSGILGLLSFLLMLGYALYIGVSKKNTTYIAFAVLIFLISLIENSLEVNKGVFFYAFFNTFFFILSPRVLNKSAHSQAVSFVPRGIANEN